MREDRQHRPTMLFAVMAAIIFLVVPNAPGTAEELVAAEVSPAAEQLRRAEGLHRRALELDHIGKYTEALPLAREALAIREAGLDPKDPLVAESLNAVGVALQESDYKAARPLLERALTIRRETLPPEHPAIAESLTNLSRTLYAGGQFAEARPLLEQAVRMRETALGPTAPEVAISLIHLSIVVSQLGDLQQSRTLMERALSILEPLER